MSDDLVFSIFKEIAIMEGKRTTDGQWTVNDPKELSRMLIRAFGIVRRASAPHETAA